MDNISAEHGDCLKDGRKISDRLYCTAITTPRVVYFQCVSLLLPQASLYITETIVSQPGFFPGCFYNIVVVYVCFMFYFLVFSVYLFVLSICRSHVSAQSVNLCVPGRVK